MTPYYALFSLLIFQILSRASRLRSGQLILKDRQNARHFADFTLGCELRNRLREIPLGKEFYAPREA
jgi:hypothetical protein